MRRNREFCIFIALKKMKQSFCDGLVGQRTHQFGYDMEKYVFS